MSELRVEISSLAGGLAKVLRCRGELDAHTFGEMEGALKAVTDAGEKRIIIDLGNVRYMASRGLGMFLDARKVIEGYGGVLILLGPNDAVRDTIGVLGFDSIFTIVSSEQEAIATFEGPS